MRNTLRGLESVRAQTIPGLLESNIIKLHENFCDRLSAGDANVPLLRIDSFEGPLKGASVTKEGKLASGWYNGISNPLSRRTLNPTNLSLLTEAMNALPVGSPNTLPLKRQVHVSGIRSNGCFHSVYDLNDRPNEVGKVFDLVGWPFANPRP